MLVLVPWEVAVVVVLGTRIRAPRLAMYSAALFAEVWFSRYTLEAKLPELLLRASGPAMMVLPTSLACSPVLESTMLMAL